MNKTTLSKMIVNRKKFSATAIMAILMISTAIMIMPPALGQYTQMPDRATQTEIAASPARVGVGQTAIINIMTYPGPNGPTYEAQSLVPSLTGGFSNISVTVTHPDGTKETFMPIDMTLEQIGIKIPGQAQIVGHLQFAYTPTKVGNYTFTASFPGKLYTTDNQHPTLKISVYYKPSASTVPAKLTVQEEPVLAGILNGYPWSPLPKEYWNNPVNTNNREWAAITGAWSQLGYNEQATDYNPLSTAPNSPHIMWSRQTGSSGLVGGEWGSLPLGASAAAPNIILNGMMYMAAKTSGYFECRDLRTGQLQWEAAGSVTCAQRYDPVYQTASQLNEGQIDQWLWGTSSGNWVRYNVWTGAVIQNITGAPTDTTGTKFENNSPIVWVNQASLTSYNKTMPLKLGYSYLIKWNWSKVTGNNWRTGIEWNVTTQTSTSPTDIDVGDNNFRGPVAIPYQEANVVVVRTPNAMQVMEGFDYTTGKLLWKNNATVFDIDVQAQGIATSPSGPNLKQDGASPNWVAYDVRTGKEVWRGSTGNIPWSLLPAYTFVYNNGVHFLGSYDGHVYAYSNKDGKLVWQSDYLGEEFETVYNNQPFNGKAAGADGKLYYSTATTYSMMPRTRFHRLVCINETTGKFIWNLPIGIAPSAIAYGYLVGADSDNGIQYCIGKGPSSTTVQTPLAGVTAGKSILIKGTVMDLSPGNPNTPAIADEDMAEWMSYLYGQNATLINNPPAVKGVPVTLLAVGSDGSYTEIGTTTSDSSGTFLMKWVPPKADTYKITASFLGTESYFSSWAETGIVVDPVSENGNNTNPIVATTDNTPILYSIAGAAVAIIIAVAIVGLLLYRKQP
jgi:outer membrane protein assembly factor BamB